METQKLIRAQLNLNIWIKQRDQNRKHGIVYLYWPLAKEILNSVLESSSSKTDHLTLKVSDGFSRLCNLRLVLFPNNFASGQRSHIIVIGPIPNYFRLAI